MVIFVIDLRNMSAPWTATELQAASANATKDYQESLIAAVMCFATIFVGSIGAALSATNLTDVFEKIVAGEISALTVSGLIGLGAVVVALGMTADMWARNTAKNSTGTKDDTYKHMIWSATILLGAAIVISLLPLAEAYGGKRAFVLVGGSSLVSLCIVVAGSLTATVASTISMSPVTHAVAIAQATNHL